MKFWWIGLVLAAPAWGNMITGFEEEGFGKLPPGTKTRKQLDERVFDDGDIKDSIRNRFSIASNRLSIPGTASTAPLPDIARVVGPMGVTDSYRIGDTIFLRWTAPANPQVGERFSTYTPALILQNLEDSTDFSVVSRTPENEKNERFRRAGYFYESTGVVRVTRVTQGLVEVVIESIAGQISIGDQIMPVLPKVLMPKPRLGGIQLSAAIVSGSPADRLSTTPRSFIYINRGSRDGIAPGHVFQSVEPTWLEGKRPGPDMLSGEAIVVYVSDSFSVASITRQFEAIRIGSLLKTKEAGDDLPSMKPFQNLYQGRMKAGVPEGEQIPTVPNFEEMKSQGNLSLPDPALPKPKPAAPSLSELDAIERANKFNSLTDKEKERLGTLSRQEKVDVEDDAGDAPSPAPVDSSFGESKATSPKSGKKKRAVRSRDEEELNQLMMQN